MKMVTIPVNFRFEKDICDFYLCRREQFHIHNLNEPS